VGKYGDSNIVGRSKISVAAIQERAASADAVVEAAHLFRERGAATIDEVSERLLDRELPAGRRRYDRLVLLELERLDREARKGAPVYWMTVWKPPVFSRAWFKRLFTGK